MDTNLVIVLIIAHKRELNSYEVASLKQCYKVLQRYPIKIIVPDGLDISFYKEILPQAEFDFIPPVWQSTYAMFNRLKIEPFLYLRYSKYKYILFYESDSYVFRDELEYWCNKGYDYIGAPWFEGFDMADENSPILPYAGNGGFSLRKTDSLLKVLKPWFILKGPHELISEFWELYKLKIIFKIPHIFLHILGYRNNSKWFINDYSGNEDIFWSTYGKIYFPDFKIATSQEAIPFSFEMLPVRLYKINKNQLPFGCHGWFSDKNIEFWKNFIDSRLKNAAEKISDEYKKQAVKRSMKIVHISTYDFGGAGISARRLHLGLSNIGVESKMLVLRRSSSGNGVFEFIQNDNFLKRRWKRIRGSRISREFDTYKDSRLKDMEIFSDDRSLYEISKHPIVRQADIVHLHWIAKMVDYTQLFPYLIGKRVVWTLHDMNPFTGGCHYSGDCDKYKTACHTCFQLGSVIKNDLSQKVWMRKTKSYKNQKMHIVAPSKWLVDSARESRLFKGFRVEVIPYGVPTGIFTERNPQYSRELLGLPKDKLLILFGAQSVANARKGADYLKKALILLKDKVDSSKIGLIIFGDLASFELRDIGINFFALGSINDELLLSACYSAADIFISPSLEDNLPNTVLESMACATPVVAFNTGGVPDVVIPGKTGLLAEVKNSEDLAKQLEWMINHASERQEMGINARKLIEQGFTLEIQAKKYYELYTSLPR